MKVLMCILLMLVMFSVPLEAKKKRHSGKRYVELIDRSKIKKFNPNAVWKKEPCKYCHGTGFKISEKYDAKHNKMIRKLYPCPYCHGEGTCGMSCK